jgi:predicted N-acetyltransferase YhbS
MSNDGFVDVDRLTESQAQDLHALYQNEWWTRGRTLAATRTMLLHTDLLFGICERDTGRLVAFARVLTDRAFKAFIFDLIVAPEQRAKGLGSRLVRRIVEHPDLRAVGHIDLNCRPELTAYYGRLGFTTDVGGTLLMRRCNPG